MKSLQESIIENMVNETSSDVYHVVGMFPGTSGNSEIHIKMTLEDPKDKKEFEKWLDELFKKGFVPTWNND